MTSDTSGLKREIESFKQFTSKLSDKINSVGDIWQDANFASLQTQIGELAKASRSVVENGDMVCKNAERFFTVAKEDVK